MNHTPSPSDPIIAESEYKAFVAVWGDRSHAIFDNSRVEISSQSVRLLNNGEYIRARVNSWEGSSSAKLSPPQVSRMMQDLSLIDQCLRSLVKDCLSQTLLAPKENQPPLNWGEARLVAARNKSIELCPKKQRDSQMLQSIYEELRSRIDAQESLTGLSPDQLFDAVTSRMEDKSPEEKIATLVMDWLDLYSVEINVIARARQKMNLALLDIMGMNIKEVEQGEVVHLLFCFLANEGIERPYLVLKAFSCTELRQTPSFLIDAMIDEMLKSVVNELFLILIKPLEEQSNE